MPKDFRGRCKGYAFVEYENAADCANAIEGADQTQYILFPDPFLFCLPAISCCLPSQSLIYRLFGRTIRLEPATGGPRTASDGPRQFDRRGGGERRPYTPRDGGERREYRPRERFENREPREYTPRDDPSEPQSREFSTLRNCAGVIAARRPVQLTQMNALVGRRMFGLAASVVLRRRLM